MSAGVGRRLGGWVLVAMTAGAVALLVAGILYREGCDAPGLRAVLRATARLSAGLLALVMVARPLRQLWPAAPSAWLLRNRRYLGLSFAVSQLTHAAAVAALSGFSLTRLWRGAGWFTTIFGGTGFAFVLLMAVTSFAPVVSWLGRRRFRLLHTVGIYYLTIVFLNTYVPAAIAVPAYTPMVLLLLCGPALRVLAFARSGRGAAAPPRG